MADDFCLDEDAGVAYVTTHRHNTIDRVPLKPGGSGTRQIVAGDPFDEQLAGPSSAAWGRRPGDCGRVAYVTSDGGLVAPPPDGIVRPAKLLRAELPITGAPDTTHAPARTTTDGARTRRQTQPCRHVPAPAIPATPERIINQLANPGERSFPPDRNMRKVQTMATIQQLPAHPAAGDQVPLVTSRTHPAPLMGPADPGTTAPLMGPAAIGAVIPLMGLAAPGFTPLMDPHTGQRSFSHRKETP